MKIERYTNWNATQMMRVLDTTCPQCKKAVRFAMPDDEFVSEEAKWLEEENTKLRESLFRLANILDTLSRRSYRPVQQSDTPRQPHKDDADDETTKDT